QAPFSPTSPVEDQPLRNRLAEVTLRIGEWALLAPPDVAPRVWDATAAMADRMAGWADSGWRVESEVDLDRYTFGVAGAVGLLLSDLWAWYDGTQTDRSLAVGFGRGLQAVNILRNHVEDRERGVDFFPTGWTAAQMQHYARRNLDLAEAYTRSLPGGPALEFCTVPLTLAKATMAALARGETKLARAVVLELVERAISGLPSMAAFSRGGAPPVDNPVALARRASRPE
ncbi:MAG: squalene/phytoene synthase family protein, partial [Chloroflexota bacterium]